ncbi:hypothetical protein EGW08_020097 [Elysia chlorotica]|uniref:NTR domain-containing protein n=1 Tax=Elysia chlorotica TaxID=188477 RepID=A0A3S1BQ66_ELYCH|nr:hypothetical protein EGW08_020097 [Elysia chlorotica]
MGHSTTIAVAFLLFGMATTTMGCSTKFSISDFEQLYCKASVVFRGEITSAMSSQAVNEQGKRIESSRITFQVEQIFKGKDGFGDDEISVLHTWREGVDNCQSGFFRDQSQYFLVFASGSSYLTVDTCHHSFPMDCVPWAFLHSLRDGNVQC